MNFNTQILATGLLIALLPWQLKAENQIQNITPAVEAVEVLQGDTIDIPLEYSAEITNMTGVGITLSFDANKLQFSGFSDSYQKGIVGFDTQAKTNLSSNSNKTTTNNNQNAIASIAWASIDGKWPGEQQSPLTLTIAHFKVLDTSDSVTQISITGEAAAKSVVPETSVSVAIGQGNTLAVNETTGGGGAMPWLFLPFFLVLVFLKKRLFKRNLNKVISVN